ncbi:MAG: ABC transporter permease [Deinococcus sp.]|uniref:ABC transporter permease n=1 Tax=Deinococcus sp. TaxID=47478 RepID=UPI0026DC1085|nr:ABC transporter permease [Deinococcus sp.]MDO4245710.1 ABC transporter permease [Deinococcus sp.]
MTHLPDSRPSPTAARVALIASGVALAALLLTPLAALGRTFDGAPVLLHLFGSLHNFSANTDVRLPPSAPTQMLGLTSFALTLATLFGAWKRQNWFWITGLLAALTSVAAVVLLGQALGAEVARVAADDTLRRPVKVRLRSFYEGGGMNLGLLASVLGGLVAASAGLSARPAWWERFNRMRGLLVPVAAIALAIAVGAVVVLLVQPPINQTGAPLGLWGSWLARTDLVYFVYSTLFAPVTSLNPFLDSLKLATPLIFTGLSVAFAFRTGLFNIGAPGQLTMGAIAAMLVGVYAPASLGWLLMPLSVIAAGAGGALWGAIPGVLKARFGSSEVINTIMLNYIAAGIFVFLIGSNEFPFLGKTYSLPFKAEGYEAQSAELHEAARLPTLLDLLNVGKEGATVLSLGWLFALVAYLVARPLLRRTRQGGWLALGAALLVGLLTWRIGVPIDIAGSQLNASFLLALVCVALFGTLMWRTATGYALRAVGLSPKAAEYGGISVARGTILAMTIAGMFAGLAATHYVQGGALDDYRLKQNMPVNVGFDGIAVALMGQSTPAGVVASSLLFGTIDTGGIDADLRLDAINKDIVTVLKALIVLFIAAGGFLSRRVTDPPPLNLAGPGEPNAAPKLPNVGQSSRGQPGSGQGTDGIDKGPHTQDSRPSSGQQGSN